MGRGNKKYYKDMHQQAYDILNSMQSFGESKKEAVANGTADGKIFSFNTYKTYWKHTKYFIEYVKTEHPNCTTIKSARKYVNEWLESRVEMMKDGYSASSVHTDAKAVGKLYGIKETDKDYFQPPKRERQNIKRSRGDAVRDKHFSITNNDELIKFARGTGLRRSELEDLKGKDLLSKDDIQKMIQSTKDERKLEILKDALKFDSEYFIHVRNGKGGRERISPIIGKNQEQIVERIKNTEKDKKVWQHVNSNADIHGYRGDYATEIYKKYARDIEKIPFDKINKGTGRAYQSEVYCCRKDEAGRKLDKAAMKKCTKALGHNRINVVAEHYLRGL